MILENVFVHPYIPAIISCKGSVTKLGEFLRAFVLLRLLTYNRCSVFGKACEIDPMDTCNTSYSLECGANKLCDCINGEFDFFNHYENVDCNFIFVKALFVMAQKGVDVPSHCLTTAYVAINSLNVKKVGFQNH